MRTKKIRSGREPPPGGRRAEDADRAMASLYRTHYRPLVRLVTLLVTDMATAEDIVQESFAAVHGMWYTRPDAGAALSYLRRSVILRSRSAPRLPVTGDMPPSRRRGDRPRAASPLPDSAVMAALRALPACQREVMVLRYFAELSEAEIVSATGMSPAAVRNHTARATSSLRAGLRPAGD